MRRYSVIALGFLCVAVAYGGDGTAAATATQPTSPHPVATKPGAALLLRVRQALPEGWSLKLHARGQGKTLVVSRDRPIRIVYNSPIAPSPIEQTLQITIVAGPKASPARSVGVSR